MKRGDIVIVREPGTPAAKPRPCVVIQRSSALPSAAKMTLCPLTTTLRGAAGQRPFVAPSAQNGLAKPSEVEVDWIYTHRREFVSDPIGAVDTATLDQIDLALRRWLDL
jgi:mRNA interferase MazF